MRGDADSRGGADDDETSPVGRHVFNMSRNDVQSVSCCGRFTSDGAFGAIAARADITRSSRRVCVRSRLQPAVPRKKDATLRKGDRMTAHHAKLSERRSAWCHETQMNGDTHLVALHDLIGGVRQRLSSRVHHTGDGILHRNHRELRLARDHASDRVWEGRAGYRDRTVWPVRSNGELTERAEFSLKRNARRVGRAVAGGDCGGFVHAGKDIDRIALAP